MKKLTTVFFLAWLTTACSTVPVTESSGEKVPAEHIFQPELTTPQPGHTTKVTFFRDKGYLGSGCGNKILVNDQHIFTINQGEYQSIYLIPGNYTFALGSGKGLCAYNPVVSQSTLLVDGAEERYRIMIIREDMKLRLLKMK